MQLGTGHTLLGSGFTLLGGELPEPVWIRPTADWFDIGGWQVGKGIQRQGVALRVEIGAVTKAGFALQGPPPPPPSSLGTLGVLAGLFGLAALATSPAPAVRVPPVPAPREPAAPFERPAPRSPRRERPAPRRRPTVTKAYSVEAELRRPPEDRIPPPHASFAEEMRRCGHDDCVACRKVPSHGPYLTAHWRDKKTGKVKSMYLGRRSKH